jgi:hypothetical protein
MWVSSVATTPNVWSHHVGGLGYYKNKGAAFDLAMLSRTGQLGLLGWRLIGCLVDSDAAVALIFVGLPDPIHAARGAPHTNKTLGAPRALRPVDCLPHTLGLAELADRQPPQRVLRVGIRLGFGNARHLFLGISSQSGWTTDWFFLFFFGISCGSSCPASSALMVIALAVTVVRRVFLAGAIAHGTALNVITVQVPILLARVTEPGPRKLRCFGV